MAHRRKPRADPRDLERLARANARCDELWSRLIRVTHALEKERARARRYARKIERQVNPPPACEAVPPNPE